MKQLGASIVLGTLVSITSCAGTGGTETDNPATTLKGFRSSGCKNMDASPGQQALSVASDLEGLQCVSWQKQDGALQLALGNFPEPCGDKYLGDARVVDEALQLSVYKDTCALFKCGWCVYDFDFTVSGIPLEKPLKIRLGSAVCESEPTSFDAEVTLPLDQQDSGTVCRYMPSSPLQWYASGRGSCGERNMPCGQCLGSANVPCASGLTCSELSDNDSRCLPTCETDDDCVAGVTTCEAGVCQASVSF